MPLLGKIVVIKRNGADGTEFPLTASCLFGRKLDCDIRIQLPQVSKEHCRIELNENKELILTNLSSVNPTLINGEILQQSERLKHGDLITVIDRSFRFEYPPAPTPKKKRLSTPGKGEAVKVLQDQQVRSTPGTTEKKKSEHATDTCLKDGSNLPGSLDQSVEDQQNKSSMDSTMSPFSDLYNMVKRDLANKPMWKSASLSNTPLSRLSVDIQELKKGSSENDKPVTPRSAQKKRRSSAAKLVEGAQTENLPAQVKTATPVVQGEQKRCSEGIDTHVSPKKTPQTTPQKFTTDQVAQQIAVESPSTKSPKTRRSSASHSPEDQPASQNPPEPTEVEEVKVKQVTRTSPRTSAGKRSCEVVTTPTSDNKGNGQTSRKKHRCDDLPLPAPKRKRVSFGGQLSPELFDKRLPPNSPLRRGATPGRHSLGLSQKPYSLLRRASTIGLMGYQLNEDIIESPAKSTSPKRAASPAKTPSPARTPKALSPAKTPVRTPKAPSPARTPKASSPARTPKTPSPAKKSPNPKAKTPSPKISKTPPPSSNLSTPKSSRRLSNASAKSSSPSDGSLLKTPALHGRFSVSRISTPSPIHDQEKEVKEEESVPVVEKSRELVTPKATPRRISMKASARKTPKSVLKSALDVVRSRRSGASRANLKVVSSWADIVKFGQAKPQMKVGAKKTATKRTAVKQTKVTKPKTPACRLKYHTSTGHADSPANIVVGKAHLRSTQLVGAAPKLVCNVALFKKDMKMDEDFTEVSDILKTPANSRRKSACTKNIECPATPLGGGEITEVSVMNTPEESGEMVVSPMSAVSTAKLGPYSSKAVTRLLQDEELDYSDALSSSEVSTLLLMHSEDQTVCKKTAPVQTPQHKPAPSDCLTGVKRLMRTPKQKAEPIEDLRGKLLKTPKEPKLPQDDSLDGIKELLNTPKQKGNLLEEDKAGLKGLMKTPVDTNSPVVCAVSLRRLVLTPKDKAEQEENLIGVKQLLKTPKQKKQPVEEDLTGIQQMMKTPKQKKQAADEDLTGIQQMMKTPKQKKQAADEDLTGIQQMMKTPELRNLPIKEDLTGDQQIMKTPKPKKRTAEEDLVGIQEMKETPKQKKRAVKEDLTGIQQMMKTPKQKSQLVKEDLTGDQPIMKTLKPKKQTVEEDLAGIQQMMKIPKQKWQPVEDLVGVKRLLQTPKEKGQAVENDFGIDHLMKTPKGNQDEAVVGSTIVPELCFVDSGVMPVRVASEKSKEKENICLVQDMMNNTEKAEAKTCCQDVEVMANVNETVCTALEAPPSATPSEQEQPSNRSSPAKKTRSGTQVRKAQKSQKSPEHQVESDSLPVAGTKEEHSADSVKSVSSVRGKRGKSAVELVKEVPVRSPARKSTRGRIPREHVETPKSSCTFAEDEQVAPKPRRGRKIQHMEVLQVGPVTDSKASVKVGASVKSPAPVRTKRGRKEKPVSENPQETEAVSEASLEVALESADLQPSTETEPHAKPSTRARRGRARKEPTTVTEVEETADIKNPNVVLESFKIESENEGSLKSATKTKRVWFMTNETLKTPQVEESSEPTPIVVESDVKSSDIVVEPKSPGQMEVQSAVGTEDHVKPNPKSRRGRAAKLEPPVTTRVEKNSKAASDSEVLPEERTQMPMVKSRRGRRVNPAVEDEYNAEPHMNECQPKPEASAVRSSRSARNKQVKLQMEETANGPATVTVGTAAVTEEPAEEPVVRSIRGGRRTKQPKSQVLEDSQEKAQDEPSIDSETIQAPVVRSARGRRPAAVKDEPETPAKRGRCKATVEVPRLVVKLSRSRKAAAKSEPEVAEDGTVVAEPVAETSNKTKVTSSVQEGVSVSSEVVPRRGRGRLAKRSKVSTDDTSVNGAEEESRLTSEKKEEPAAKDDAETKQSVKGRKGRTARKQVEEPVKEKPAAEETVQPVRRGRAGASVVSQDDKAAACPKKGQRSKNIEVVDEKTPDTESLPKRGKAVDAEQEAAVPLKGQRNAIKEGEETCEVKAEESSKNEKKPIRGRRKAAQEDVLPQDSEPTSRRGTRGQKKAETDGPSAPVRRTRRK